MSDVFWTLFIEILSYAGCLILLKCKWLDKAVIIGFIAILLNLLTQSTIVINHILQLNIPTQYVSFHLSFLFLGNLLRLGFVNNKKSALWFSFFYIAM